MPKPSPRRNPLEVDAEKEKPLKRLGTELHHCSQCNRPTGHEVFEHPKGVKMICPCGYAFVDVRETDDSRES